MNVQVRAELCDTVQGCGGSGGSTHQSGRRTRQVVWQRQCFDIMLTLNVTKDSTQHLLGEMLERKSVLVSNDRQLGVGSQNPCCGPTFICGIEPYAIGIPIPIP